MATHTRMRLTAPQKRLTSNPGRGTFASHRRIPVANPAMSSPMITMWGRT